MRRLVVGGSHRVSCLWLANLRPNSVFLRTKLMSKYGVGWRGLPSQQQRCFASSTTDGSLIPLLSDDSLKKEWVAFTPEEDALLLKRVDEWGDKGRGKWASIAKELGRSPASVNSRHKTLMQRIKLTGYHISDQIQTEPVVSRGHWNETMDARLREGVTLFGSIDRWGAIAEHVGHGKKPLACLKRWEKYFQDEKAHRRSQKPWTDADVYRFISLFACYIRFVTLTYLSLSLIISVKVAELLALAELPSFHNEDHINWHSVGKALHRMPRECEQKWKSVSKHDSKGPFKAIEDVLILQRAAEWGKKTRHGLWNSLALELGRSENSIRARWFRLQAGLQNRLQWNEQMDAALLKEKEKLTSGGTKRISEEIWIKIAKQLTDQGWPVLPKQCRDHFYRFLKFKQEGLRTEIDWTPKLVDSLKELRQKGLNWASIGRALRITPSMAVNKWTRLQNEKINRGKFTPEEDALIRQRVAEWGDPREKKGLWPILQKEMGRLSQRIRHRWFSSLFHKE